VPKKGLYGRVSQLDIMPLNKFWEFIDKIQIKHFLFLAVTCASVTGIGIWGWFSLVDDLLLTGVYHQAVVIFHIFLFSAGGLFFILAIFALLVILDVV